MAFGQGAASHHGVVGATHVTAEGKPDHCEGSDRAGARDQKDD